MRLTAFFLCKSWLELFFMPLTYANQSRTIQKLSQDLKTFPTIKKELKWVCKWPLAAVPEASCAAAGHSQSSAPSPAGGLCLVWAAGLCYAQQWHVIGKAEIQQWVWQYLSIAMLNLKESLTMVRPWPWYHGCLHLCKVRSVCSSHDSADPGC